MTHLRVSKNLLLFCGAPSKCFEYTIPKCHEKEINVNVILNSYFAITISYFEIEKNCHI